MDLELVETKNDEGEQVFRRLSYQVFQSALPSLPPLQFESIAEMQFQGKLKSYLSDWPQAKCYLVLYQKEPIGHIILNDDENERRIVDIIIDSNYRNQGIGAKALTAIEKIIYKGSQLTLSLSVQKDSNAFHLYKRLGYQVANESEFRFDMLKTLT